MNRVIHRAGSLLALAVLAAACADPAEPPAQDRTLGILQMEDASGMLGVQDPSARDTTIRWTDPPGESVLVPPEVLAVPAEVQAGQPFTVEVMTIGAGGCWSAESQDVQISNRTVELTPYDVHSGHSACTMILLSLSHESTVQLDEAGEWTIRVSGRRARHGDQTWETPVSAEKVIVVR
jgi:hypothetical protein